MQCYFCYLNKMFCKPLKILTTSIISPLSCYKKYNSDCSKYFSGHLLLLSRISQEVIIVFIEIINLLWSLWSKSQHKPMIDTVLSNQWYCWLISWGKIVKIINLAIKNIIVIVASISLVIFFRFLERHHRKL